MRILHVASSQRTIDLFVRPLDMSAKADGVKFDYLDSHDFSDLRILQRGARSIRTWRFRRFVARRINESRPDVLVVHTPATALSLLPVLRSFAGRRVYISRGGFHEGRGGVIAKLWSVIDPARWRCWDRVGVVNREQLERLRKAGIDAHLLPLGGLNLGEVHISAAPDPPVPFTLGWVGRFDKDKQLELFLLVLSRLQSDGHAVKGIVVGDAIEGDRGETTRLRRVYAHLPVRWTGWLADPNVEYPRMSLLVSTSRREGYGRTIVEAARAGVPTVGFATEGTTQSIRDAAGIIVQTVAVDDLASTCARLMMSKQAYDDLRRETINAARELAKIDVWDAWRGLLI